MSARTSETNCSYSFDPAEWEATTGLESPITEDDFGDDEVWRCPHATQDDNDRCVFHLSPDEKTNEAVREALLSQIDQPGRTDKQFIGAKLGTLDLAHAIVESSDNHPIDLRHAEFTHATTWEYAIVRQPLRFEGAIFHDGADFTETIFANEVYFTTARFDDRARFIESSFEDGGWFYRCQFEGANFSLAEFGDRVDFIQADFERAQFREAVFSNRVDFKNATFEHAMFAGAEFHSGAYFTEASLPARANFAHAEFADVCEFAELAVPDTGACIEFQDSRIAGGALLQPDDGMVIYRLDEAVIGDVAIAEGTPPTDLFTKYRFLDTMFDGFEFAPYRDALNAADWMIHETTSLPISDRSARTPSPGTLESTYLKAKNGANTVSDTKAAAEFFRNEMRYRRYQYVSQLRGAPSWMARATGAWRWGANLLLDLTAGYGERPSRVVLTSVGVILFFTGLFGLATDAAPYDSPLGYLLLSLEAFITLVLGGAEDVTEPWLRLLAEVEGFIGAFLIALFVFTLTRSIHR